MVMTKLKLISTITCDMSTYIYYNDLFYFKVSKYNLKILNLIYIVSISTIEHNISQ